MPCLAALLSLPLGEQYEAGTLSPARQRTTVGRIIFNQILPDRLRYSNAIMKRAELKRLVDECYRLLRRGAWRFFDPELVDVFIRERIGEEFARSV